jgi:hypothetical protein
MAMGVDELIPLCQEDGLGRAPWPIGVLDVSMGGCVALLMATCPPSSCFLADHLARTVALIRPNPGFRPIASLSPQYKQ